jgi:hypothetical protein
MKSIVSSLIAALTVTLAGTPAWAAAGGRQDNSSMVVWAFLAFCALIVIAQLVPAIRNARQAAKEEKERKVEAGMVRVATDK